MAGLLVNLKKRFLELGEKKKDIPMMQCNRENIC